MSRIDAWKCDICKEIFIQNRNDPYYLNPSEVNLTVTSPNSYYAKIEHSFSHVCLKCRKIICEKIWNAIDECQGIGQ